MRPDHHSPHKVGFSLHANHFSYLEKHPPTEVAWLEATTECYLDAQTSASEMLTLIRGDYPIALHGGSLNIGSSSGPDVFYLEKLRDLIERIEPFTVSDHICWTGISSENIHDRLPLPQTQECLQQVVDNIDFIQNFLRRSLTLENISSYLSFQDNEMTEWAFLSEISQRSGCSLLLNLTSLYVNSYNHDANAFDVLREIPIDRVAQIHLSGVAHCGSYILETGADSPPEDALDLLTHIAQYVGHLPVGLELQRNAPSFTHLEIETRKIASILEKRHETQRSSIHV